jgi:hypothetical protein
MTNPRDVKYANESIARWQDSLKRRAMLETNNIAFACLRGFLLELRGRLPLADNDGGGHDAERDDADDDGRERVDVGRNTQA